MDISFKFGSLDNMRITSSDLKDYLGVLGKGLITYLGLKTNIISNKYQKARYAITNFSIKGLSNIIKEFENYFIRVMCGRGPNINPLTVTFT